MKVLAICGSLRKRSSDLGLLRFAAAHAPAGMHITIADLALVLFYNSDITDTPASVKKLLSQCEEADAFIFACPEYNYSIAPALKNAIDWASRAPNNSSLGGKAAAFMGAGGGMGTSRAQSLRTNLKSFATLLQLLLTILEISSSRKPRSASANNPQPCRPSTGDSPGLKNPPLKDTNHQNYLRFQK